MNLLEPMIRPASAIVLLVLCNGLGSSIAASQEMEQLQALAAYSHQVNQITVQYGTVFNRTMEYDSLAYGVVDGKLSAEEADRQARALSNELWNEHKRLNARLDALPGIPSSAEGENLRVRFEAIRAMARSSKEMARTSILSGEELVQAAIAGDEDVFSRLEVRSTELMMAQLAQQATLYDLHLSTEDERHFNYYLTAAMKSETEALVLILGAIVRGLKSGAPEDLSSAKLEVQSWLDKGYYHIEVGREIARNTLRSLSSSVPGNPAEEHLYEAIIELLEGNVPESFEVELQILREIASFNEKGYVLDEDELDAFAVRLTGLEEKRGNLLLERQRRLAAPQ